MRERENKNRVGNIRTFVVVGVVLFALQSAAAQQPTVPAALDFTCHGYDEGATRAYNCIPAAGQESMMPTFVPPVGSTCNGGSIDEFPAGRLVFQIRCQETRTPPPTTGGADVTIQNVRRYDAIIHDSDWVYFDIVAGTRYNPFRLQVRLHYADGTFRLCNESVPAMSPGQVEEGLIIPAVCGPDVPWTAVEFVPPVNLSCNGCSRYSSRGLAYGRAIPPLAPDSALETDFVIEDYRRRSTIGR